MKDETRKPDAIQLRRCFEMALENALDTLKEWGANPNENESNVPTLDELLEINIEFTANDHGCSGWNAEILATATDAEFLFGMPAEISGYAVLRHLAGAPATPTVGFAGNLLDNEFRGADALRAEIAEDEFNRFEIANC
jgi:hypothetical protein